MKKGNLEFLIFIILTFTLILMLEYLLFTIITYTMFNCFGIEYLWSTNTPIGFWLLRLCFTQSTFTYKNSK